MGDAPIKANSLVELREALLAEPSTAVRGGVATEVAQQFAAGAMTERERGLALQILDHLAVDVARQVREALADQLKSCPTLPPALVRRLAADIESVSLPVIRSSPVLGEDDMLVLVRNGSTAKRIAIAGRESVPTQVSAALVDTGDSSVVATLLDNSGARISEQSLHKVIDQFESDDDIQDRLVKRVNLPLTVVDRMIETVSDTLRARLIERHGLPWAFAHELAKQAGEGALIGRVIADPRVSEVERLVHDLYGKNMLTPTLMLRALCMGDSHFFEVAIARVAGLPVENAMQLIYDHGPLGLKAIYEKAHLPPDFFPAFQTAVRAVDDVKNVRHESWRKVHSRMLIEQLMHQYHPTAFPPALEHFLSQLSFRILDLQPEPMA